MAIKRCPYCRSIIDEADRYCENCGTQLLFPEDENIEEDIPGEKILEAEDNLPDENLEIPSRDDTIEPPFEPTPAEEEIELEPPRPQKSTEIPDLDFTPPARRTESESLPDSARKFATRDLPEMDREFGTPPEPPAAPSFETPAEETGLPEDFEVGFPVSKEESEDIARVMSSVEKEAPPKAPAPPPASQEEEEVAFSEKDLPPLRFEEEKPATSDELPPWAERVKDGVTPGFRAPTGEDLSRDREDLSFETDSVMDRLSRAAEEEPGIGDGEFRSAEPEFRPRPRRRRRGPLSRLKARLYDFLLITLLWGAALWAASRILSVPLFNIIANSALQVGVFYLILLAGYFALFFSFLGETLGDRLSSPPA